MPRMPGGFSDPLQMMKAQSELMAEMPSLVADMQKAVRDLVESVAGIKESVEAAQRVSARVESVLDEIEEPVRSLRPGLIRLAATLDAPVIDRIPVVLAAVDEAVMPVAERFQRVRRRLADAAHRRADLRDSLRNAVSRVSARRRP